VSRGFLLSECDEFISIAFPGATFTTAVGVNARGEIVGSYVTGTPATRHGFLLKHGAYSSIDVPGATFTNARGINSRGDVVGEYRDAAGVVHGFLLKRGHSW
jgi:uncharacterized membrane protein